MICTAVNKLGTEFLREFLPTLSWSQKGLGLIRLSVSLDRLTLVAQDASLGQISNSSLYTTSTRTQLERTKHTHTYTHTHAHIEFYSKKIIKETDMSNLFQTLITCKCKRTRIFSIYHLPSEIMSLKVLLIKNQGCLSPIPQSTYSRNSWHFGFHFHFQKKKKNCFWVKSIAQSPHLPPLSVWTKRNVVTDGPWM